jgi:hypothetical protein
MGEQILSTLEAIKTATELIEVDLYRARLSSIAESIAGSGDDMRNEYEALLYVIASIHAVYEPDYRATKSFYRR